MLRFVANRVASLLGIVFVVSVGCFLLTHLLGGDPTRAIMGPEWSPQGAKALTAQLGLNKPLWQQYLIWVGRALEGNLGNSQAGSTVAVLKNSYRYDLELVVYSQVLAYLFAVPLSVYAAKRPRGALDQTATAGTFALYCMPAFVLALLMINFFSIKWHIFPGPAANPFPTGVPFWTYLRHNLAVFFLPSFILALGSIALYFRLLRGEMGQTLQEEFVTVARSKGLSDRRILWRHALRPSMVTLLASTGTNIALLITGLFLVEYIFDLPGVGFNLVQAIPGQNYILVQGIALVTAVTVVVVNFLVDLVIGFVDPRIAARA